MVERIINISKKRSFFLFGARGTGKTYLLNRLFKEKLYLDLLLPNLFRRYSAYPEGLIEDVEGYLEKLNKTAEPAWVIIDEVQRIPELLNVVHHLLEKHKNLLFALSGSSARKLKRGGANLLAGRATVYNLYPFTVSELKYTSIEELLQWGTLPLCILEKDKKERVNYLQAYVHTYLREEVLEEQLVRKLSPFQRFLSIAGQSSGQIINYSKIARYIATSPETVQGYFSILEDTLLGFTLPSYHTSIRKRQRVAPKFYIFDNGVGRTMQDTIKLPLSPKTYEYGRWFEHFIIQEIYRYEHYQNNYNSLFYLRTRDNTEIDLIIERKGEPPYLIEIKSTNQVSKEQIRSL
ncbi:MAG: ATP-binding protein, partial [Candidatus Dadabacteria bacterium]